MFRANPSGLVGQEKWHSAQTYSVHHQLAACCLSVCLSDCLSRCLYTYLCPQPPKQTAAIHSSTVIIYCGFKQSGELMHCWSHNTNSIDEPLGCCLRPLWPLSVNGFGQDLQQGKRASRCWIGFTALNVPDRFRPLAFITQWPTYMYWLMYIHKHRHVHNAQAHKQQQHTHTHTHTDMHTKQLLLYTCRHADFALYYFAKYCSDSIENESA